MLARIFLLTTVLFLSGVSHAQWVSRNTGLDTARIRTMHFTSASTGFAVGDTNSFYKTTDGGEHWTKLDPLNCGNCPINYSRIKVFTTGRGYVWGRDTSRRAQIVLGTIDHGQSWQMSDSTVVNVPYLSETFGYDISSFYGESRIRTTSDLGQTWNQLYASRYEPYYDLVDIRGAFGDEQNANLFDFRHDGHAGSYQSHLHKIFTTDGGKTWANSILRPDHFTPAGNLRWFGVRGDTIVRSDDGGKNWPGISVPGYTFGFAPLTYDIIYGAISNSQYVTRSNDGGANWAKEYVADTLSSVRSIQRFASNGEETLYMLARGTTWPGARVFKQTNAISSVSSNATTAAIGALLSGKILYVTADGIPELLDIMGRSVPLGALRIENNRWQFDVRNLASGVYFVRAGTQSFKILVR